MKIDTRFGCGDHAFAIVDKTIMEVTIGQVRVEVTKSPGQGDSMFDNYKPQSGYVEVYMAVETGIGSGNLYTLGEHIFGTYVEAEIGLEKLLEKYPGDKA